jgi:hypothetical protein
MLKSVYVAWSDLISFKFVAGYESYETWALQKDLASFEMWC